MSNKIIIINATMLVPANEEIILSKRYIKLVNTIIAIDWNKFLNMKTIAFFKQTNMFLFSKVIAVLKTIQT